MGRMPWVARSTLVATLVAMTSLAACSSGASESCGTRTLELDGVTYDGYEAHDVVAGEPLGRGVVPGCDDVPADGRDRGEAVDVVTVPGVDPARAVALAGVTDELYLAPDLGAGELPDAVQRMLDVADR